MSAENDAALAELRQFLALGVRDDLQQSALKLLLSLASDENFPQQQASSKLFNDVITDLCQLFPHTNEANKSTILAVFVNLSANSRQIAANLIQSKNLVFSFSVECTYSSVANSRTLSAQLLSNLSRFFPDQLYEYLTSVDQNYLQKLIGHLNSAQTEKEDDQSAHTYLGFLLVNLSTTHPANSHIAECLLPSLIALLSQSVPLSRRLAALNTIYNLSMLDDLHRLLLRDEDGLLTALLWPLADSQDQLDDEEMAQLPLELQYWERSREQEGTIRDRVLRTLYQLCATRVGREVLRRKGVYALLRELDKARGGGAAQMAEGRICTFVGESAGENGDKLDLLRAVIGVLIRTEADMGLEEEEGANGSHSIRALGAAYPLLPNPGSGGPDEADGR